MDSQPSDSPMVLFGMLFTVAVHGLIIYWIYASAHANAAEPKAAFELPVTTVEILGFGEPRDPNELPEHAVTEEEVQQQEAVVVNREPEPEPQPDEPDERRETQEEVEEERPQDDAHANPHRPTNDRTPEGSQDGLRGHRGVSDSQLNHWATLIFGAIERRYQRPQGISDTELSSLEGRIQIYFNRDGRITRWRWRDRSGNRLWDDSVETALNQFRFGSYRLPLPFDNEGLLDALVDQGLRLVFQF